MADDLQPVIRHVRRFGKIVLLWTFLAVIVDALPLGAWFAADALKPGLSDHLGRGLPDVLRVVVVSLTVFVPGPVVATLYMLNRAGRLSSVYVAASIALFSLMLGGSFVLAHLHNDRAEIAEAEQQAAWQAAKELEENERSARTAATRQKWQAVYDADANGRYAREDEVRERRVKKSNVSAVQAAYRTSVVFAWDATGYPSVRINSSEFVIDQGKNHASCNALLLEIGAGWAFEREITENCGALLYKAQYADTPEACWHVYLTLSHDVPFAGWRDLNRACLHIVALKLSNSAK